MYKIDQLVAWIDISTFCNARCPQCHRNDINGLGKAKWLPLIQWSVDQFKAAWPPTSMTYISRFEICGTWGDPMMCKDIYEIVEYIIDNSKCKIQINTNGGMRDETFWWKLGVIGRGRLQVIFDVDGINQEMHARYRREVDFAKLRENVIAYVDGGGNAFAHIIMFKHNQDYIEDIVDMAINEWGMSDFLVQPSNRFFNGPVFEFTDEQGVQQTLEEATLKEHPLLRDLSLAPLRDHNWWKQKGNHKMYRNTREYVERDIQ